MKTKLRQNQILAILRAMQCEVSVDELSSILHVAPLSIRRDLKVLSEQKAIIRTHGGCMIAGRISLDTVYHKKVSKNFDLKQAIGKKAVSFVQPGDILLIDDGSSTFHLATYLHEQEPLSVYTNSLALISELTRYPGIKLNILGGTVNTNQYSVSGYLTEQNIESINFDKVFLGSDAIGSDGKVYVNDDTMAKLSQVMLRSGKKKILLCDHTKVGSKGTFAYGTLNDFDQWVTSHGIRQDLLENYSNMTEITITHPITK